MSLTEFLRSYKITYEIYNFLNLSKVYYLKKAYKKYGIRRAVYRSVNYAYLHKHGNANQETPWLDTPEAIKEMQENPGYQHFNPNIQAQLVNFSKEGFAVLPGFFSEEKVDAINTEIECLIQQKEVGFRYGGKKLMFANKYSQLIREVTKSPELLKILDFLMGKKVIPFQTINFLYGSGQRTHSDTIHMATYPLGYLVAVWIALEDISAESGPLVYYPGSHTLPYVLSHHYDSGSTSFKIGGSAYKNYEDKIEKMINESGLQPKTFLAKKGDVFIWHANLLHGGSKVLDESSTRKSMVIHYYCEDVICFHEITQRPAFMPY